ncbi:MULTISPECIES: DNA translocase FtsK [Sphingomonas]|jgi:S-DNA-T family DNA segregation ATPase FtsK/SpoIIIE|uniref:DNA translocase FtsK n=1 Tax=Sphingomonas hankookensis TaxID=563996 RepID=A0ABR5YB58_9SPHN|nr:MULTISPECIES: DNA translocase FtsK [Sphingomonas]KZE13472.1 cell division protein FtsK [Sphingomonas hankookensis]PZT90937.1 MAG: DNA translocase FtsK [Sphingomonas sp.]WCP72039.1 DNA translocase FtsK 4TM domain-containing protein [Sphingomonas hankookensis]
MATNAQPMLWRDAMKAGAKRSGAMIGATLLFVAMIVIAVALASYSPADPSFSTAAGGPVANKLGSGGAMLADLLLTLFGVAVAMLLPLGLIVSVRLWRDVPVGPWPRMVRDCLIGVLAMGTMLAFVSGEAILSLPAGYGGVIGWSIAQAVQGLIHLIGVPVAELWTIRVVALATGLFGVWRWAKGLTIDIPDGTFRMPKFERRARVGADEGDVLVEDDDLPFDPAPRAPLLADDEEDDDVPARPQPRRVAQADDRAPPVIAERAASPALASAPKPASSEGRDNFALPSIDLLAPPPESTGPAIDKAALERNSRLLESVLDDFNVKGQVVKVAPGPVVTMYELEPEPGIRASRVIQLADDIARNMSAISARVATIPGRTVIGIELPNQRREMVSLRELIASQAFADQNAQLPIVLGKNIAGDPVVADLAPMPHLLVAGTTGSGKSVGLNCMILSLLYRLTPDQCRMIMIDPKMLELSMYRGIPHLLADVVTDPPKAVRALKWAVEQMEDRYRMMASINVRSLASFNDKVRASLAKGQKLGRKVQTGYDADTGTPIYEEETLDLTPLPQIVVIVDELADLMMTAGKEVEFLIQRLAQKARAAGIHLIMATQRPSVDVITGVIKANLPTRISFHVTSKIDSRTILGEQGAEQLLGRGDMLYMPGGKALARVHGPFVSDDEVQAVSDFWRSQGAPDYIDAVVNEPEGDAGFSLNGAPTGDDSPEEQTFRQACQLVAESQKASTSWLQRQLRVGYNSAARLIERMEKEGLVSRPDHVGRREVLMDPDGRPTG